jgi:signal transduction histidine kinase
MKVSRDWIGRLIGMRVWLAVVFAALVAGTAASVAAVFVGRFDGAFEERAEEIAVGVSVDAAIRLSDAERPRDAARLAEIVAAEGSLALFVFDRSGELLTPSRSQGVSLAMIPSYEHALDVALDGGRYVSASEDGTGTLVGLRVRDGAAGAIVAYASHPELEAGVGVARSTITEAALWGSLVGALAGILVAALIAGRLRRIAASAAEIERGDFDHEVSARFPDEVGALAASLDRMRVRLRESFAGLASERDRLTRLLERLHEGVVTVSADGNVEFANDAATEIFAPHDLREGALVPEAWAGVELRELVAALFRPDARVAHLRLEDETRTVALVGIPARGSDTVVLVFEDVSERERRERAEREFVTNAAHELRTPLQTILGGVEALRAGAKDDPADLDRFLALIEREGMRLGRLTRALLVLARAQTRAEGVALSRVELRPLLEEVASGAETRDAVELEIACPPGLAAHADRDLLEQALANLAANAVRHTEAGRIRLVARALAAGSVAVEVVDTGSGIAAAERERVFDRFYRGGGRGPEGFGLGLAIARESAKAIGGQVELESSPEGGTTARLVVRAAEREAA